ncbi:translocation and assembly module TamA precursor [mine drainage metagenome]|uniref:Translocation and assembly module TamA n=1 Tax=mine drainage metagenome TaxID=410659 RepID=A0A1J5QYL9_9ZZZZ
MSSRIPPRREQAPLRGLRAVLLAGLLLMAGTGAAAATPAAATAAQGAAAPAAEPACRLRIDAPAPLAELLRRNLDLARWCALPSVPQAQLDALMRQLPAQARRLLETEGHFSAKVSASAVPATSPPAIEVRVDPGPVVRVAGVTLTVTGADPRSDAALQAQLQRRWTLPVGAVFRDADWEAAKSRALSQLLGVRWPAARIAHSRAAVDPASHRVELALELDTGAAYTFGALRISGLHRYPASVVRHLSPPARASRYDQAALLAYQARLQDSPYFRNALVGTELDQAEGDELPIDVRVVENPAHKLGFGAGVSSDTGRSVQMDWRDLDFGGRARRLNAAIKLETLQQSGSLLLALPRSAAGDDDSVAVAHTRSDIQGLVARNTTATAQRARSRDGIDTSLVLQYQIESTQPIGAPSSIVHALSLSAGWTRRDLDSVLAPRRGSVLGVQLGGASRALASSASFVRADARGIVYLPLSRRDTFVTRGEVGAVLSSGASGIPQNFLFRAGGAQSVRGYAYQSLGLVDGGAIIGARYLLAGSAELDHWFTPTWGGATFFDAGNAADSWSALKPVRGYGVGVRWRSPVGLIALDLAYGQALHTFRLNFSAGVAF